MSSNLPIATGVAITHVSYAVDDLEAAAQSWAQAFGAGPFYVFERLSFDVLEYNGTSATWDHSVAFGQWGPIAVELQQTFAVSPSTLRDKLTPATPGIGHLAYTVKDPEAENARLTNLGMRKFLFAKTGPAEETWHTAPWLGHAVEIHRKTEFADGFFANLRRTSENWSGKRPLRVGLLSVTSRALARCAPVAEWLRRRSTDRIRAGGEPVAEVT